MSELTELPKKSCHICQKSDAQMLRCAKCKAVNYCGRQCQKQDWPNHKKICKNPEEKASKDTSSRNKENQTKKKSQGLDQFGQLEHIGSGNFSIIFKAKSKADGQTYAIKQIQKNKVQRMRKQADVFMEKHCLMKLKQCVHVVNLYKTFQDELSVYFQMQFPQKGQLWEISKSFGIIPQSLYQYYAASIVKAISVLHNQYNIVHRDLKPQNILINKNNEIKLIDFGTAKDLDRPDIKGAGNGLKGKKPFEHYVGTPHYMAPQCIHNKASQKKSDIYSLGGVLYFLKVGSPPFQGGSQYLTFTKSLEKKLLTCDELFSPQLQDLIGKMNDKQMDKRPSINQIMQHKYFQEIDFQNIPKYDEAVQKITEQQKYLCQLCQKLLKILEREKQPKLEQRKQIYQKQIEPMMNQQLQACIQNKERQKTKNKLQIIKLQCRTYLNLDDNTNISFTQLYEKWKTA